ncbi:MAG: NADH-quinone oxidoreductase subunit NuoF [Chloroflexota bacterium]|nr:MAG: NADH-quinone oxidoreductase subunit NuoF [Chloroflexota bacterium]HDD61231.1 NADH-quinone oxidoreductase subunit NuoF [Chloroflexota bacterium]
MPVLKNISELNDFRKQAQAQLSDREDNKLTIILGMGTCGIAAGANQVADAVRLELKKHKLDAEIVNVGCIGMCHNEPLLDIQQPGQPRITYKNVKPAMVGKIIEKHLLNGEFSKRWIYGQLPARDGTTVEGIPTYDELPFYGKQVRIALKNCGIIDPESLEEYLASGGYGGLEKALFQMSPDEVIEEMKDSGLRGRGGAGFTTGLKWEFCRKAKNTPKYLICNADEGDPGAFMDRSVLEGDPHALLEGMIIAAYAIGATEGYIYCRAEYPLAIERLKIAIKQAYTLGLLGNNILGSKVVFNLKIKEGAGAFVCGEETALIASIEGKRGEPRPRPPYPAVSGLWGKPTNVNNVKSFAITSQIMMNGADWFNQIGTEKSTGTAVFALTGKIKNTGLVEVPMGISLREIIYDIGGGIPDKKEFKAVQTGGPLGGCLPEEALDTAVDFDSLTAAGATMGSGGMIVVDQDTCMVEFARYFLTFASAESCGKCVPCRIGGQRLLEVLTRITNGEGTLDDLDEIEDISKYMREGSLCALGQLTPGPVMASLRFFREEYEAHITEGFCEAGVCADMFTYEIDADPCTGCGLCLKACPTKAITGEKKEPHIIDQSTCIQCGACYDVCNFGAVLVKRKHEVIQVETA